jgi:hypothetical protein
MRDVFDAYPDALAKIDPDDSYLRSYQALAKHFATVSTFDVDTFIVAAHAVYGWMPTILEFAIEADDDLPRAVSAINRARREFFRDGELDHLVRVVNNSLVGVSKLLHFASPQRFAIWDSNVYQFVFEKKPYHYRMNTTKDFADYHETLRRLSEDSRFPLLQSAVNAKLKYVVKPFRALELVMFYSVR